ncbi:MAG: glycosyltransferase family 4 protein [Candidatus Hadarchaeales archaeon]
MMRILIGSDFFYPVLPGGGERRMYEIGKRLAKNHEVHVITRKVEGLPAFETHENMYIHRIYTPGKKATLLKFVDGLSFMGFGFLKTAGLGKFDVYAPQHFFPIPPLWMGARIFDSPVVVTIHDVFFTKEWIANYGIGGYAMMAFEKLSLAIPYSKIVAVSNSTKEKLVAAGVSPGNIEVIPNGVDLNLFDSVKAEKSKKLRVIYVGRLIEYKHLDDLLLAFSKLKIDCELYVVGVGYERERLEKMARGLGISKKVVFTGFVSDEEKIRLLKSSHIFVLPSTVEGFGIAVVEAMAAGVPTLCADIPALREVTENGRVGVLFRPRDVEELKEKLEKMASDEKLRKKLSEAGHKNVIEKYSWDRVATKMEEVLEKAI